MPLSKKTSNSLILLRAGSALCLALLGLFVSSCSDSRPEHQAPSSEQARGSAHPALKAKVTTPLPVPAPAPAGAPKPAAAPAAADYKAGEEFEVMKMKVKPPEGWLRQKPANRMRKAQFKLPRAEGDEHDGELTVIPAFGGMEANLQRWRAQFKEGPQPLINNRKVSGLDVSIVQIDGTYLYKARPMDPAETAQERPDYRVLAAIVQAPGGQLFFKSFGPRSTMEKWQEAFTDMVDSFKPAQE
jgi:hypothetical protein